jgi:uncharacterized membrane protein YdjX (TVP38/TMEM64 family)
MDSKPQLKKHLIQDAFFIIVSIILAIVLVRTGIIGQAIVSLHQFAVLGSFIVGMFFTSVFTTAPAIAALGEMATLHSPMLVALVGAMGAVVGDLLIFKFVRDRFSNDLMSVIKTREPNQRLEKLIHMKFFRWFMFFIGGLIIASPLPDELGISMLGFSKMKLSQFIPISFTFNFLGILFIGYVARAL